MNIRIITGTTWLKMAICLDRWQNVFFFNRHKSFQHGLMATFKPCPDCAKQGIVSPIVPRRISETVAIWKCNSTATTGCIYPMSQSLAFFKSQFVPVSSIDERMFRRYVHYDVRSDPEHSDTNNSTTPQPSPSSTSFVAAVEMNVVQQPISDSSLTLAARPAEQSVAKTTAVSSDSTISVKIPDPSASTATSSPFSDDLPLRPQPQPPVATTARPNAPPPAPKPKFKDVVTCKGDELLDDSYAVKKRPPPRLQTSTGVPTKFLQHLARKRPNTDLDSLDKKKEQSLPSMDKVFVRSTKAAKSLMPSLRGIGGVETSFDGYRPSLTATTAAGGASPYPSSYSPNMFSYGPPIKRSTDDGSQKSDDGSTSSQGKSSKDSRLFSSNVRSRLVSSIASRKAPQGKSTPSPGSSFNRTPTSEFGASTSAAVQSQSTMSLPPASTSGAQTVCSNVEFDLTFDPFSLGDWPTTSTAVGQTSRTVPNGDGLSDFFDYVPNFTTSTTAASYGNEHTPFFVDVDDPASCSAAVVYQQL